MAAVREQDRGDSLDEGATTGYPTYYLMTSFRGSEENVTSISFIIPLTSSCLSLFAPPVRAVKILLYTLGRRHTPFSCLLSPLGFTAILKVPVACYFAQLFPSSFVV
jgi:hypothetical protein